MQIVLSTSPAEGHSWSTGGIPTLGLAYLAGSVRHVPDVRVKILDGLAEGLTIDQATERVLSLSCDVFGITVTSLTIQRGLKLLVSIKKARPDVLTIVGGYHATAFDDLLLTRVRELDMVMRGEVDRSFPELVRRLLRGDDIAGVPGLSYRSGDKIIRGEPQYVRGLDTVPFPDRAAIDYQGYWKQWAGFVLPKLPSAATIVSSRGCPNHCTFCSKLTPGSRLYRIRSARNVLEELLELYEDGYRMVAFVDENFSQDVGRVRELCKMIIDHNLDMRFVFQGVLHNLSQSDLFLMHRAGFDCALVGVESGSDEQLNRFKKAADSRQIADGIKRAKKAHMVVIAFFIHGGPGETESDCEATKTFVREVRPHVCATGELMIHPGSILWKELIGEELTKKTIEASRIRMIHSLPGQLSKEIIETRMRDFQRTFEKSWINWRRISEAIDLLLFNPTVRYGFLGAFNRPGVISQFFKTQRPGESKSQIVKECKRR